ncbi:SPOR domain-containing protein [Lysobacter terrae]
MLVRALIVLLLILNAGAAAWWIAHDPAPARAATPASPGIARLQLVSERAAVAPPAPLAAAAPAATTPPAEPPPATAQAAPTRECYSFGPFATRDAGTAASTRLQALVQSLTLREQAAAASTARGWRVYLPPLPSLEQAQAIADRIAAAGFSDFLVVREGAEANSIALGRYAGEQAAKKRADALNAAGFAAQAEALGGAERAFWLDAIADASFDARRAQALVSAAQHRRIDCPAAR